MGIRNVGWMALFTGLSCAVAGKMDEVYPSPVALVASGVRLYVAEGPSRRIAIWDTRGGKLVGTVGLPAEPTGMVLTSDGRRLLVTCADPLGRICEVDPGGRKIVRTIPAGHGVCGPALSPDGKTLYVCNRFDNEVAAIDLASGRRVWRVAVPREPVSCAVTSDGRLLLVANHLPTGPANVDVVAAEVSVIDLARREVVARIRLPNGGGSARQIVVSPDGEVAYVPHIVGRFHLPTTQLERGWMNTNALTIIDIAKLELLNTVLLDDVDSGAANPWGVACSDDGQLVCVTHAGTHELSVIDAPALLDKLRSLPASAGEVGADGSSTGYDGGSLTAADVVNRLSFLVGLRRRVALPGRGPRAVTVVGHRAWVGQYFSNNVVAVDLDAEGRDEPTVLAPPGADRPPTLVRLGEDYFHDASRCFQGWQSCSSCHPDARTDALNWDLLNDGIGNPKNVRTMLNAHRTPPAMSIGVRETAESAVRAGIRFIEFAMRPEEDAVAIDEYLKSLRPVPSPYLVDGQLSEAARRGQQLFTDPQVDCGSCHQGELYTDLQQYDVGTATGREEGTLLDTPALVEAWRTAPYLHDGSAATFRDVLTTRNLDDRHGRTSQLTDRQIEDLIAYLRSL